MKKSVISRVVLTSILSALPVTAWSWGSIGHYAICELAEKKVTPKTREALRKILGKMSLAQACNHMDEVRSHPDRATYEKTFPWHFVEVPNGHTIDNAPRSPQGDALEAMIRMEQKLKSRTGSAFEQFEALAFLTHLLGDVHQPLHVGNGQDMGANTCVVSFFKRKTNLHVVWDSSLIEHLALSFTELARFVDILDTKTETAYRKGDYKDWITESANVRDQLYPKVFAGGKEVPGRPYCKKREEGTVEDSMIPELGYDYAFQTRALLNQRLIQAGIRIAVVLDRIYGGSGGTVKRADAKERIPTSAQF